LKIVFDWDPAKATANLRKHRIAFESAIAVFNDPLSVSIADDVNESAELRWITIGAGSSELLVVIHTFDESDSELVAVRIISVRRPTRREISNYREGTF
jgi:uncharacterized protein